jgi:hypothetical protein
LKEFLAKLPEMWRKGEVRATHRAPEPKARHWRTHKDPLESVWAEILLWLQSDPEASAKSLLERLQLAYPGKYPDGQVRTLQRRIREWRRVMSRTLVNIYIDNIPAITPVIVGAK